MKNFYGSQSNNYAFLSFEGSLESKAYYGLDGNDILIGSPELGMFDGGNGFDTLSFLNSSFWYYQYSFADAPVEMYASIPIGGYLEVYINYAGGQSILKNVEMIEGTNYNDVLYACKTRYTNLSNLIGGNGDDQLYADNQYLGSGQSNTLFGGGGNDKLYADITQDGYKQKLYGGSGLHKTFPKINKTFLILDQSR